MRGRVLTSVVGGVVCLAGVAIAADLRQSSHGDIIAVRSASELTIETVDGRTNYELPNGVEVSRIATTDTGWLAAGTVSGGADLVLLADRNGRLTLERVPATGRETVKAHPVLFVDGGRRAGIAWFEGADDGSMQIFAATRKRDSWDVTRRVAGRAAGTQTALDGTVLADGSWLLVWSAFDGEDDEILWSQGGPMGWSRPSRIAADNQTPDIVPSVVATTTGALVAWSRYEDEHYRVVVAELDETGTWAAPVEVGGIGTVFPRWVDDGEHRHLVYRQAQPGVWIVDRFDDDNGVIARWSVAGRPGPTPALTEGEDGPELLFADGRRERPQPVLVLR